MPTKNYLTRAHGQRSAQSQANALKKAKGQVAGQAAARKAQPARKRVPGASNEAAAKAFAEASKAFRSFAPVRQNTRAVSRAAKRAVSRAAKRR